MAKNRGNPRGNIESLKTSWGHKNTNGAKPWKEALRISLACYADKKIDLERGQALRRIADVTVSMALGGDMSAIQEIANRLDGKPVQAIEGTGEGGAMVVKWLEQ